MAVTFDKRPIYLGDRIVLAATYEATDTNAATGTVVSPPGMVIDAVIEMNTEAPTNINMHTSGNANTQTQAVLAATRRTFTLTGVSQDPGTDNGDGKLLIYGRRA